MTSDLHPLIAIFIWIMVIGGAFRIAHLFVGLIERIVLLIRNRRSRSTL